MEILFYSVHSLMAQMTLERNLLLLLPIELGIANNFLKVVSVLMVKGANSPIL